MITWLASYPRSGNTMMRTILFKTMGIGTYADELEPPGLVCQDLNEIKKDIGVRLHHGEFRDFYREATERRDTIVVKSHLPPRDDQPAIYIVRDARPSMYSYWKFYHSFVPETTKTIWNFMVGDCAYCDWTRHFEDWNRNRQGPLLLLRYEEMVAATPEILQRVADFIGYQGPIRPWENPMFEYNAAWPQFFRKGDAEWKIPPEWTDEMEYMCRQIHGPLLRELGYLPADTPELERPPGMEAIESFIWSWRQTARNYYTMERVADERQDAIMVLDAAVRELMANRQRRPFYRRWQTAG